MGAKLSGARREGTSAYLNFTGISDVLLSFFLQGGLVPRPGQEMERKRSWLTRI
jgi:hypothetical protein